MTDDAATRPSDDTITTRSRPRSSRAPDAIVENPASSPAPITVVSCVVEAPKARSSVGRNNGIHRSAVFATVLAPVSRTRVFTPNVGPRS